MRRICPPWRPWPSWGAGRRRGGGWRPGRSPSEIPLVQPEAPRHAPVASRGRGAGRKSRPVRRCEIPQAPDQTGRALRPRGPRLAGAALRVARVPRLPGGRFAAATTARGLPRALAFVALSGRVPALRSAACQRFGPGMPAARLAFRALGLPPSRGQGRFPRIRHGDAACLRLPHVSVVSALRPRQPRPGAATTRRAYCYPPSPPTFAQMQWGGVDKRQLPEGHPLPPAASTALSPITRALPCPALPGPESAACPKPAIAIPENLLLSVRSQKLSATTIPYQALFF